MSKSDNSNKEDEQTSVKNQLLIPVSIEKLDTCLNDEFRFQLNETLTHTYWAEVNHGAWGVRIKFFDYLDKQIERVYKLKDKPLSLKAHFDQINPSLQPYLESLENLETPKSDVTENKKSIINADETETISNLPDIRFLGFANTENLENLENPKCAACSCVMERAQDGSSWFCPMGCGSIPY